VLNTVAAVLVSLSVSVPLLVGWTDALDLVLLWLAVSLATNAFPSMADARAAREAVLAPSAAAWERLLGYPVVLVLLVGAVLARTGLSIMWGAAIVSLAPLILLARLAS